MNRHLAAILAYDVVGYSKMMGADEVGKGGRWFPVGVLSKGAR